jgi:uncharacterized DUF497 family protein
MRFEWDEDKNGRNIRRHKVSFELAMDVFHDPFSLTVEDRTEAGEQRLWTIGSVRRLVIVVVVHTV